METLDVSALQPDAETIEAFEAATEAARQELDRIATALRELSARRAALVLDGDPAEIAAIDADLAVLPDRAKRVTHLLARLDLRLRSMRYAREVERQRQRIAEAETKKRAYLDAVLTEYPALAERILAIRALGIEARDAILGARQYPKTDPEIPATFLPIPNVFWSGDGVPKVACELLESPPDGPFTPPWALRQTLMLPGFSLSPPHRQDDKFAPPKPPVTATVLSAPQPRTAPVGVTITKAGGTPVVYSGHAVLARAFPR